jgi:hypothetical protein
MFVFFYIGGIVDHHCLNFLFIIWMIITNLNILNIHMFLTFAPI